ncbi:hypothetical protein WJX73_005626 [Symbiochloris irregularis]|uniref:DNA-directed RNA polymerase subunit beta n=1 Tax=Symbiochloris irregularis TaxID=706552 RepID=A0AAW1NM12_9CHLO
MSQSSGFTVVAERLNFFRYMSHFRSVHRGAYFAQLRTTAVRKLMPESWGFLCPVHTPDGAPCGLLNHFAAACRIVTWPLDDPLATRTAIAQVMTSLGMIPSMPLRPIPAPPQYTPVTLDGIILGHMQTSLVEAAVARLRVLKTLTLAMSEVGSLPTGTVPPQGPEELIPPHMEVAHIPYARGGPYPGVYLHTAPARMHRPVTHLASGMRELIGSLEQSHLNVRCPDGGLGGSKGLVYSHAEEGTGAMLSIVASLTPFSDYNQSPRNMYQCQMGKQTMGTPLQAFPHRTDGKLYRIMSPQTPVARTKRYDAYCMDEHPNGTNMVVAVLAYTSYDMEDAMILNRAGIHRGLARGVVYKNETIDLRRRNPPAYLGIDPKPPAKAMRGGFARIGDAEERPKTIFGQKFPQNEPSKAESAAVSQKKVQPVGGYADAERMGTDGLPHPGTVLYPGQGYYSIVEPISGKAKTTVLKGEEVVNIDQVTLLGGDNRWAKANITMRIPRPPYIGDKFSSRHGQKGVLSQHYPDTDMPFCAATGMRPDLIINPHAFPSRMTIGMLLESLASKAAVLGGQFVNASPFQGFDEADYSSEAATDAQSRARLVKKFADQLESFGFQRHGGETMISGITGEEFAADIFIGPVYYQRLRHMVADKFQVRSTGGVNAMTRQPIKGRKLGGGIRFGEMERDALLAHGAANLLHDRLHTCSDYSVLPVCGRCKSLLSPHAKPRQRNMTGLADFGLDGDAGREVLTCRSCGSGSAIEQVACPFIFHYLATELAAMNIKCNLTLRNTPS